METWKLARSKWAQIAVAVVGVVIVSAAFFAHKSVAQNGGNGFSVSPTRIVIDSEQAQPGASVQTEDITVTNVTSETITAQVDVRDFVAGENEDGTPVVVVDDELELETTIKEYAQPIEPFTLESGESRTLRATFNIPANATPGSHFGAILFTAQNADTDQNVALSASVGPIVLMEVAGDITTDLQLVEASTTSDDDDDPLTAGESQSFFTGAPINFKLRLQNNGNTFLQPSGTIQVKNVFGSVVDSYEVNSPDSDSAERSYVLPDQIRRFENRLSDDLIFGRYTVEGTVSYIGGSGDLIQVSESFWVVPYWLIAVIVVLIALIVAAPKFLLRYNRGVINRSRR